jgi:hypothetical protein
MELPASTLELHFGPDGVLCAALLAALVRMLTSTEAPKDPLPLTISFSFHSSSSQSPSRYSTASRTVR